MMDLISYTEFLEEGGALEDSDMKQITVTP
jgi:hypothetical protein